MPWWRRGQVHRDVNTWNPGQKSFTCFPFQTFKEKSERKKKQIFSVIPVFTTTKNFIWVLINSKIDQFVFPLLFLLSILFGVLMRRKVFKRENQKQSPRSKWSTTWSSALGPGKGEEVPCWLESQVVAQCGKTGPEKMKLQRVSHLKSHTLL